MKSVIEACLAANAPLILGSQGTIPCAAFMHGSTRNAIKRIGSYRSDCPDPGHDAQHKTSDHPPGSGAEEVSVTQPTQPSSDNQRSKHFGSDPNRLAEPRVQWIL